MNEVIERITVSRSLRLMPGETEDQAMVRRIKMHEFLMTGGVQVGRDKDGQMTYSGPITAAGYPVCPWHGEDCLAWDEIVAGRGYWTQMEAELATAEAALAVETNESQVEFIQSQIENLTLALELRPRDALALRERSDEQIEAERAEVNRRRAKRNAEFEKITKAAKEVAEAARNGGELPLVYAKAGPKQGGNPWDRGPKEKLNRKTGEITETWWSDPEPEDDSRNDAVAAFATEDLPDTIVVDGDEGEEGDE